ncbi:MAG: LPS export ABC transporter periplasmic protein LptC [Nitrospiraceae bacterium]|nr:LPS export ABC transporter periplasmic protein LptC [Nitrospiraceae bacterium]
MKKIMFVALSAFLIGMFTFYFNYEKDMKAGVKMSEYSYMDDVSIVQRKAGVHKWTLNSKKAVFVNENDVDLEKVTIDFPEKGLVLNSDTGSYHMGTKSFTVQGNIKASTNDYDIVADKLTWNAETQQLTSDTKVNIVGKRFSVIGDRLEAVTDKAKLLNNVKAVFHGK